MRFVRRPGLRALLGLAASTTFLSSCMVRTDRFRATTPPIRLVAATEFPLWNPATRTAPASMACTVRDVEGLLSAVHGDTLSLIQLRIHQRARTSPGCPELHTAFVVVSEHVQLRARVDKASRLGRFFRLGFSAASFVGMTFLLIAVARLVLFLW